MPQPRIEVSGSRRHISQATALWLLACGTHRWVIDRMGKTVERVPFPEAMREREVIPKRKGPYIPETLPPIEVSGCVFDDPQERPGKTFWLLAARNFVQSEVLGAAQLPASPGEAEQALTL